MNRFIDSFAQVLTTHYILDTVDPKWERGIELFVQDYTRISLTFLVYDWDGPLAGDDFLGMAKLNLTVVSCLIHLLLMYNNF